MKIKNLWMLLILPITFSCEKYEDYTAETAGYTTIYFPWQELQRSMVSGEGMYIDVGVFLGGLRVNNEDRTIQFTAANASFLEEFNIDNGTEYELLPSNYYTLSNTNEIIVPEGKFQGFVRVQFDSLAIAQDADFTDFKYAIPFEISESTTAVDSILINKETTVIPLRLMNTYEGNYWQIGEVRKFFNEDRVIEEFIKYGDSLDTGNTPLRLLNTENVNTAIVNGVANLSDGDNIQMGLQVNNDNSVTLLPLTDGYEVEPNGENRWNPKLRRFTLNYKYTQEGFTYEVTETLFFRDRNRDGINEWRWPGFPGSTF